MVLLRSSASHKLIHSKEHGSVQISIAKVDGNGVATNEAVTVILSKNIRRSGDGDAHFSELCRNAEIQCVETAEIPI